MHRSSFDKMTAFRQKYLAGRENQPLRIIDIGAQDVKSSPFTYRQIFDAPAWRYQGVDMVAGDNVDIVLGDPYRWQEIASESIDVLISGQAFEHVEYIWITMMEVARVLKPGGFACIIAPAGGVEHRYPLDCWRFYPDGFNALGKWAGLDVLEARTQWQPEGYADGSDMWQDSVLICRKPEGGLSHRWKRWLIHRLSTSIAPPLKPGARQT